MIKLIVASFFIIVSPALIAQQPAAPGAAAPQAAQAVPAKGVVYTILQPSMDTVLNTLENLKIDKWKKGSVRDEATQNVQSVLHDIQNRVPNLVTDADSAPGSLSKAMPLVNHLDALYEVLLRVEEASRVSAPSDQISQLQQALLKLNGARKALDDQLVDQAAAQEKRIADLQAQLKTQQAQAQPVKTAATDSTPCKPAAPAKKKKKSTSTTSKSATPAAGSQKPQ
jgi:hypothetical protein